MFFIIRKSSYFIFILHQYLLQQKRKLEEERNALRKEVVALRIMQTNYEQMVKAQHVSSGQIETRVSDDVKFQVVKSVLSSDYALEFIQIYEHFIIIFMVHSFTAL